MVILPPIGTYLIWIFLYSLVFGVVVPSGLVLMGIENQEDTDYYFVSLDLGTPAQRQYCRVDMGTSDSFFFSDHAAAAAESDNFADPSDIPFYPNRSSTLFYYPQSSGMFESFYFNISGVFVADNINIQTQSSYGISAEETTNSTTRLTNMTFGLVEDEGHLLKTCLIGLGLQSGELSINSMENGKASPVYDNFPIMVKNSGLVNRVSYSIFLNRTLNGPSFVLFGGVDHSKYRGNLSTVPLVDYATDASLGKQFISQPTDFQIVLSGITITDGTKSINVVQNARLPINVAFGVSTSTLPSSIGSQIARIFGMAVRSTDKSLWMPCDRKGYITFNFSGAPINIPIESFLDLNTSIRMVDGSQGCKVQIDMQDQPIWEIGNNFFRGTYVYVDLESFELSFAPGVYDSLEPIYEITPAAGNITNSTRAPLYGDSGLNSTFNVSTNNQTLYSVIAISGSRVVAPCIPTFLFAFLLIL